MSTTADESTKLKVTDLVREHKLSKVLNIDYFNDMQSIVAPDIYESDLNMVVSAPTGSGKTIVMELAILREASIAANPSDVRIIYVAPNKALCQQKVAEWTRVYGSLNMK
jgi:ATP-dependent DNA helicase HFM1/MER3